MISIDQARTRILARLTPTGAEIVPLSSGLGRVLFAPVIARLTYPAANISAMDGFALDAADAVPGTSLTIIGSAPAGHPFEGRIGSGQAVRVFTGSVIPDGADAVLVQENADFDEVRLTPHTTIARGKNIRSAGLDFRVGDNLLSSGTRLSARDVGLAAAGNCPWLSVYRRPIVALLATGDEVAMPGEPIPAGGLTNSNTFALAAFIRTCGGIPIILPTARDDRLVIAQAAESLSHADLLVTTGGASVGAHDLVQEGLSMHGLAVDFWKIAMRPGKPLMFGAMGTLPVLGLPGNPVSALVCALLFLKPAIERLSGLPGDAPQSEFARCTVALPENDRRNDHLRASLVRDPDGGWQITPFAQQDSAMLPRFAEADALLLRPPGASATPPGTVVQMIRLADHGL